MMDPVQLQLMQEAGLNLPGMSAGRYGPASGDMGLLIELANSYAPPISGPPLPDISPLAPLNLQQYGMAGVIAGAVGNVALTGMMNQSGLLPIGNAGSYSQAQRTRDFHQMRTAVAKSVAPADAESHYQIMRGAAALAGQPFNREQQEAARSLSETTASLMPELSMFAPELADALGGERGSVQAMATQMMEANRYRVDPVTGQMGYGKEANTDQVKQVFETMFASDNMARMQGLRAGDVGQMYRQLAPEGLAGPTGSLRTRTVQTLQQAREEGLDLTEIAKEQGVKLDKDQNLESLSNSDLSKLRQNSSVGSRLTQSDSRQISDQLQGYVASVSAMREVFGENGNPNAPMPQLINALKALTSGQMQKFDASQLNTMVRDMQSMSQLSGKSISQLVAMNQSANASNTQIMGEHGIYFNPAAVSVGVTTGMSFAERGGATGFGALNREQAEQASMNMFSRGVGSEMGNTLGAMKQIEDAGGFADNQAGREMTAVMESARSGSATYTFVDDNGESQTRNTPTREREFREIVSRGAIEGMDAGNFNQLLGQKTSNTRALSTDTELQKAPMRQQANEINTLSNQVVGNYLEGNSEIEKQIPDVATRGRVSAKIGKAAVSTLDKMSPEQYQDARQRNDAVADAITAEATNNGVTLTRAQALNMATGVTSTREELIVARTGQNATSYAQIMGEDVREGREEKQAMVTARSSTNEAMSGLGPQGSVIQKAFTAVQKQGDRGDSANLNTLLGDMFAADMGQAAEKLSPVMQDIKARKDEVEKLTTELEGSTPEERVRLSKEISIKNKELSAKVADTHKLAEDLGLNDQENKFNNADMATSKIAIHELDQLNRMSQVRAMAGSSKVTVDERNAATKTKLTDADLRAISVLDRQEQLAGVDAESAKDLDAMDPVARQIYEDNINKGATPERARAKVRETLRAYVGTVDQLAAEKRETFGADMVVSDLADTEKQDAVIRERRANLDFIPTAKQLDTRGDEFRKLGEGQAKKTQKEIEDLSTVERRTYEKNERELRTRAEDQLIAEGQLRALGQLGDDESLLDDPAELTNLQDPLREKLIKAKPEERAKIAFEHIDQMQQEQFYGVDEADITRKRDIAISQLATPEGRENSLRTEQNIRALSDNRREYLSDDKATAKGGALGMFAVKQSKKAEEDLQILSNRYYGGSVGDMLVSGGLAMDKKGLDTAREELAGLTAEEKEKVAVRLKEAGQDIGGGENVHEAQYSNYIALKARDAKKSMVEANEGLSGAAGQTYANMLKPTAETQAKANVLFENKASDSQSAGLQALESAAMLSGTKLEDSGLDLKDLANKISLNEKIDTSQMSKEQKDIVVMAQEMGSLTSLSREQLDSLESLSRLSSMDVKEDAKRLGVSEDDYKAMVRGDKEIDPSLKMFDTPEEFKQAKADEQALKDKKNDLAKAEATLKDNPVSKDALEEKARLEPELALMNERKSERMKKLGLDINKEEDVKKYNTKIENQGQLELLKTRKETYKEKRQDVSDASLIGDVKQDAEAMGVSEKDYKAMVRGDKEIDPSLKIFDTPEEFKQAKDEEQVLDDKKKELAKVEETLKVNPVSKDALEEKDRISSEITALETSKSERMEKLGLDSSKEEDVKKYSEQLEKQGQVESLETRKEEYKEKRQDVSEVSLIGDVKQDAEDMGVSEEEYKAMVRGDKEIDKSLKIFDTPEEFKQAKADEQALKDKKKELASAEETLKVNPVSKDALEEKDRLISEITVLEASKSERMEKEGLDSSKEEDVKKYSEQLEKQGQVESLEARKERYEEKRQELSDQGLTDVEVEKKLATMAKIEEKSQKQAEEEKGKELGSDAMNNLADAFGKESADERQELKTKLDVGGESNKRNVEMLSSTLDEVDKLKDKDGKAIVGKDGETLTKVQKLDHLTDEYAAAKTSEEKKAIANKYNMSEETLERTMKKTEFLDIAGEKKLDEKTMAEGLKSVSGRNIEEEVKKEEERTIHITGGNIEVTGDIVGTATIGDLAGIYGSR